MEVPKPYAIDMTLRLDSSELGLSTIVSGLDVPWDLAWAPGNELIYTEQGGTVSKVNVNTGKQKKLLVIPDVWRKRTAGLLGMALYPNFKDSPFVVLDYTVMKDSITWSRLVRYRYTGDTLTSPQILLEVKGNHSHNGSRVTIASDGKVYWATGDAMHAETAQDNHFLNGKILRLNIDGSIPADNPVPGNPVWSMGYRNMQGLVFAANGRLYTSEHGEANDDEVNLITKNGNYGWPNVTGYSDTDSEKVYARQHAVIGPLKAWTPTIAPAGIDYYSSNTIPEWKNSILLTTLKQNDLRILKLNTDGSAIMSEQVFFYKAFGRLRDVCVSPSGDIYITTSNRDWNPPPGYPKLADDRILRIKKIRTLKAAERKPVTATTSKTNSLYTQYCASCHQPNGKGLAGTFPALSGSALVTGDKNKLMDIVINGRTGTTAMPAFKFMTDAELATVLSYVRTNLGNKAGTIQDRDVRYFRQSTLKKEQH